MQRIQVPRVIEAEQTVLVILLAIAGCTENELVGAVDAAVSVEEIQVDETDPMSSEGEDGEGRTDSKPLAQSDKPRIRSSIAAVKATEKDSKTRAKIAWANYKCRLTSEERKESRQKLLEWDRREPAMSIESLHASF